MGSYLNIQHSLEPRAWSDEKSVNRNYPTADPKSRLPSRGRRKWNASHRAAGTAGGTLIVDPPSREASTFAEATARQDGATSS